MKRIAHLSLALLLAGELHLALGQAFSPTPDSKADTLSETGQVTIDGHLARFVIRHLPPSSFPDLPASIADLLNLRGCQIPQTYEARRPENVVHAALEHAGSEDWALLCSVKGTVSLMVFFASAPEHPMVLASAPEAGRLQPHDPSRVLGFNWGIDPASPARVHEAQSGMEHRPPLPDHDALADSIVDRKTVFHFYAKGKWTLIDLPE
jgi:hypothetical protein